VGDAQNLRSHQAVSSAAAKQQMRTAVTQFWDRRFIWHRIWHTKFQIDGAGATPAFPGQCRESIFALGSNGRRWRCDAILGSPLYLAQDLAHKVSN